MMEIRQNQIKNQYGGGGCNKQEENKPKIKKKKSNK